MTQPLIFGDRVTHRRIAIHPDRVTSITEVTDEMWEVALVDGRTIRSHPDAALSFDQAVTAWQLALGVNAATLP